MLDSFKKLKFKCFHLNTDLFTKVESITFDKDDIEDSDYFEIIQPSNNETPYVILFYNNCELVDCKIAFNDNIVEVVEEGIKNIWGGTK